MDEIVLTFSPLTALLFFGALLLAIVAALALDNRRRANKTYSSFEEAQAVADRENGTKSDPNKHPLSRFRPSPW